MEWPKYYREIAPVLPGEHSYVYRRAMAGLRLMDHHILDPNKQLNFVLGGFHNTWTVSDFISLGNKLHPGIHNNICLDMNDEPLKLLDEQSGVVRVQGKLDQPPFSKDSIDLLLLDFTLNFMQDRQIRSFATSFNDALSDAGLVLATIVQFPNQYPWEWLINWYDDVDTLTKRSVDRYKELLSPLKLNFLGQFETVIRRTLTGRIPNTYLLILSKSNSGLPIREPVPFILKRN